jgi:hypothetical protein
MARRSFRDRFFTPPVARAMVSPIGILLAGAGAAVGILAGGGIPLAIGLGAAAWAGRVGAAVPRDPRPDRIDPFTLGEPWKRMVQDALQAQNRFTEAVNGTEPGPLRDRMAEIGQQIAHGVEEAWRVGRQGQALVEARRRIDVSEAQRDLEELEGSGRPRPGSGSALERTIESLHAQLDSARRLEATIAEARDRLRLTNARLDEAVARAAELSVRAGDVGDLAGLGDDVDALVTDLEALRLGLEEVDRPATGSA